jgi:hypothetical protein
MQCLKPCKTCGMTVTVLIEEKSDNNAVAAFVSCVLEECEFDDVAITYRVNGIDQLVRCSKKSDSNNHYDDCLF